MPPPGRERPRRQRPQCDKVLKSFFLVFFATGFYVAIVIYARVTDWAESLSERKRRLTTGLEGDVSTTIAVVRVLQGLLLAASSFALTRSFYILQWGLMVRRPDGIPYTELLALSPTTLDWGSFRIFTSRNAWSRERMWAGMK